MSSLFDGPNPTSIPRPRPRFLTRIVLPTTLILATAALLVGAAWSSFFPGAPVTVVPVMVKSIEGETTTSGGLTATGWIEPDPYPYFASALISGTVSEVLVLEGERVKKDQIVARLIDDDAQIALAEREAELAVAQGDLARAEARHAAAAEHLETQIERRRAVAAAEAVVAECEADIAGLHPQELEIHAEMHSVMEDLERKKKLLAAGSASEGDVRRLHYRLEGINAALATLRAKKPTLEARADKARADLAAAEENLTRVIDERLQVSLAEADVTRARGVVGSATARRDAAQLALDRTVVRAPIDGVVMTRLISPGSPIQIEASAHSAHIAHIYDPAHLQVRVDVPLADAAAVGVDQLARVSVSALPDRSFAAKVSRFVHEADLQKNTVEVKVAIEAPNALLKPEMLARVQFLGGSSKTAMRSRVLVPERLLGGASTGSATVWVVDDRVGDRGVAARRTIALGSARHEGWVEVTSGLQPGDWLIDDPAADLEAGETVTIEREAEE